MTRSGTLRSDIARLKDTGARLSADLAKHRDALSKANAAASKKRADAGRTKSDATRRSAVSAAEREEKKAGEASEKFAEVEKKTAANEKAIAAKESSLKSALKSEQATQDRADDRRRQKELQHARQLARASSPTTIIRHVQPPPAIRETLRVLYLTANPEATETVTQLPDGTEMTQGVWLRVDCEVRQVRDMVRKSEYRDLIEVEHDPAATTMDLLEGLNQHRPHVVHFSGHSSALGLLMENDAGTQSGDTLDFGMLARLLGATDAPPRLLVLNACESLAGADELLRTVPTVVAMSDSISDASAVVFAARFYAAVASAQSVHSALEQASVAMEAASLDGHNLPEVRARDDIDLCYRSFWSSQQDNARDVRPLHLLCGREPHQFLALMTSCQNGYHPHARTTAAFLQHTLPRFNPSCTPCG